MVRIQPCPQSALQINRETVRRTFPSFKNSKKQGDAGLGIAIGWLSSQGFDVLLPLTDSQDYDLVYGVNDQFKRVQVRTATQKKPGNFVVALRVCGGNRSGSGKTKRTCDLLYDELMVVTGDGSIYRVPKAELPQSEMTLSSEREKYLVGRMTVHE
ncbi:group I intron-associated PD-(D/E)XK endonuclease [Burkholderia cenocepacia]|uniref:group I intron-associated PD-(D/E)XK endonuclease n=1 Tax=Burkholderia cenocepacia TaxID=95486 RepID=UPI001237363C